MARRRKHPKYTIDPNENAATHHTLGLCIDIPIYGKPSDDMKTAQAIKDMLKVGVHSRVEVALITLDGDTVDVPDRTWRNVEK